MTDMLGKMTKNGTETWVTYADKNTGEALYPPKPKDDETKAGVLADFLKKGGSTIVQGEGSRYKVEIDGIPCFFDPEIVPTLPPAGSSGFFNVTNFASKGKRYFSLTGMADIDEGLAVLGVMQKRADRELERAERLEMAQIAAGS